MVLKLLGFEAITSLLIAFICFSILGISLLIELVDELFDNPDPTVTYSSADDKSDSDLQFFTELSIEKYFGSANFDLFLLRKGVDAPYKPKI